LRPSTMCGSSSMIRIVFLAGIAHRPNGAAFILR